MEENMNSAENAQPVKETCCDKCECKKQETVTTSKITIAAAAVGVAALIGGLLGGAFVAGKNDMHAREYNMLRHNVMSSLEKAEENMASSMDGESMDKFYSLHDHMMGMGQGSDRKGGMSAFEESLQDHLQGMTGERKGMESKMSPANIMMLQHHMMMQVEIMKHERHMENMMQEFSSNMGQLSLDKTTTPEYLDFTNTPHQEKSSAAGGGMGRMDMRDKTAAGSTADQYVSEEVQQVTILVNMLLKKSRNAETIYSALKNKYGVTVRVASVDGKPQGLTKDYRADRVNLVVENNKVVDYWLG